LKKDDGELALERLVAEARREPPPDVDWDAMEARLMPRLGEPPRFAAPRRSPRSPLIFALAAAALAGVAAAAVAVVNRDLPPPAPIVAVAPPAAEQAARAGNARNGDALAVGDVVHADREPVAVDHDGRATWTLEPDSEAHVEELGGVIRVALDRGILSARVVKSPRPESFVVRVEGTRVAVHGTAFRVVRLDHAVRVEVTEGVVGVGPLRGPSFDVVAPASTTTTFDGVRTDLRHAARSTTSKPNERLHAGAPAEEVAAAEPEPEAPAQAEATDVPDESGKGASPEVSARAPRESSSAPSIDGVVDAVRRCFREQTVESGDLHVTVSTQMSLRIQGTGRVGEAVFTPPLAPRVRQCVDDAVGLMKFPASTNGFAVDKTLELSR
jgi:ferric-dicitrate binding protein FerR (iron transport regulator)